MVEDLSRHHEPLTDLFPRPRSREAWEPYRLSDEQVAFYHDMEALREALTPEQLAAFNPVEIELKAGRCAFHHPLMLHGSGANSTDRPRRATVVNVFRDGVRSAANEPLLAGVSPIAAGQSMQGQFFPLLFDAARA
jgi:ectoine hydroxylase-related dioxygenase (phytanoyl-CoA dioxygenase family)